MGSEKNIRIKEEYTLMQYKSEEYSIDTAKYDRGISEKLIIGDENYEPKHVIFYDSEKISQAYNDALALNVSSVDDILQYVNKYGLPITDYDYGSLQEDSNWLKYYILSPKMNTSYTPDDFFDINSVFYTQKAITLLQAIVNLQMDLHNYYFYSNNSSELSVDKIICNIFQSLICVMISLNHNCLRPSPLRQTSSTYSLNYNSLGNEMTASFQNVYDLTKEVLRYTDTVYCTHSCLFTYKLFQKLDFNSKSLTIEPLLIGLLSSGKDYKFSHGKLTPPNDSYIEIDSSFNTKHILLLLKISETAINICNKKGASLNGLFQQKLYEISFQDIYENYNYPSYEQNRKSEICNEIYTAAELFYFEIFTDLLVNCPPTVKLKHDTVIYSRRLPNLIQALLNKLYREAFIKFKICEGCGRAFPEALRRKDAEYCSETCSARFRKRRNRENEEKDR